MTTLASPRRVDWFFDFISPFAYLQWQAVKGMSGLDITYRPVLFAGLLSHLEHKGPAEIPAKRRFTYRHVQWRADRAEIPMVFPPEHPFNPLAALRLCIAAGSRRDAVDAVFDHIWGKGQPADSFDDLSAVAQRLGMMGPDRLQAPEVKQQLRGNFDAAVAAGVFGVPSFVVDGQVFWGDDATAMFEDYLANPGLFETPAMRRADDLPVGTVRRSC